MIRPELSIFLVKQMTLDKLPGPFHEKIQSFFRIAIGDH